MGCCNSPEFNFYSSKKPTNRKMYLIIEKNTNFDKVKQNGDYSKNVVIGNPLPTSKIIPFNPHLTK